MEDPIDGKVFVLDQTPVSQERNADVGGFSSHISRGFKQYYTPNSLDSNPRIVPAFNLIQSKTINEDNKERENFSK